MSCAHIKSNKNKQQKFSALKLGNKVVEKTPSMKVLGVMLDEDISWKYHIKTVENKLLKNYWFFVQSNYLMKHF